MTGLLEPDSAVLVGALALCAAAGLVGIIQLRHLALRLLCGALVMVLSAGAGMAVVNDYYGYYQSWGQLSADLTGSYSAFDGTPATSRTITSTAHGQVREEVLPGARSGIRRRGAVYLPPQYFQPRYAHATFPVVELLHGTPGSPADWVVHLHVAATLDRMIAHHQIGPMIVVMPTMSVGHRYEECVDAPGALDDTYITRDVRADILGQFRASPVPAEWGVAGFSSGGYCAANLALRHPASFGAAGIMDGYFRPGDGPAAAALRFDAAAEQANDPLLAARRLGRDVAALPSFWISAGTGNRADIAAARAFTSALHGVEEVTLHQQPGAGHNFYAWAAATPPMLQWMWTQLAPPELRVQFPITGPVTRSVLGASPPAATMEAKAAGDGAPVRGFGTKEKRRR